MNLSSTVPKGAGSAAHAPHLPSNFKQTFESRYIDTGELRLHAVIGGKGPPLLLVHGWPQNWYAWRFLMPSLAQHFEVIAVDQRGVGLSDKPAEGYDTASLAGDLAAMMSTLGHKRFAVAGHDTGFAVSYALAADHPDRVERVILLEIPGPPMTSASPPVFVPAAVNNKLWHIPFLRAETLPEQLVKGREAPFFGYEFAVQGGNVSDDAIKYYVHLVSESGALPGSFGFYRALDATLAQNEKRAAKKLTMPVLAMGGERSYGAHVGEAMNQLAENVQAVVVPGAGHWLAEEAPEAVLAALTPFLSEYRSSSPA